MLTEKQIRNLWRDEAFYGSFSGISTFYKALKKTKDNSITLKEVKKALENSDVYQMHFNSGKILKERRHIHSVGSNLDYSADLLEMPEHDGYKFGLVLR